MLCGTGILPFYAVRQRRTDFFSVLLADFCMLFGMLGVAAFAAVMPFFSMLFGMLGRVYIYHGRQQKDRLIHKGRSLEFM